MLSRGETRCCSRCTSRFVGRVCLLLSTMITVAALAETPRTLAEGRSVLWYRAPAQKWETQALPIGNGRLGGMIFGGVETEQIQLNEDSLWTGDANLSGDYATMGAYQSWGDLFFELPGHGGCQDYRRQLDISEAVANVSYSSGGVRYRRETFCSYPDQVLVVRLTADKPGSHTGR